MNNLSSRLQEAIQIYNGIKETTPNEAAPQPALSYLDHVAQKLLLAKPLTELKIFAKSINTNLQSYAVPSNHTSVVDFFQSNFGTTDLAIIFALQRNVKDCYRIKLAAISPDRDATLRTMYRDLTPDERTTLVSIIEQERTTESANEAVARNATDPYTPATF